MDGSLPNGPMPFGPRRSWRTAPVASFTCCMAFSAHAIKHRQESSVDNFAEDDEKKAKELYLVYTLLF
jgi:hypothetical protein